MDGLGAHCAVRSVMGLPWFRHNAVGRLRGVDYGSGWINQPSVNRQPRVCAPTRPCLTRVGYTKDPHVNHPIWLCHKYTLNFTNCILIVQSLVKSPPTTSDNGGYIICGPTARKGEKRMIEIANQRISSRYSVQWRQLHKTCLMQGSMLSGIFNLFVENLLIEPLTIIHSPPVLAHQCASNRD